MPLPDDPFLSTLTRRSFIKTMLAAAAASLVLPRVRATTTATKTNSFWFLHTPTGDSWPVDDPVSWSLDNAQHEPILDRAKAGLLNLTTADKDRIIRLVTRRCKLNLIEIQSERVVVHYWGQQGQGELRPFFKTHGLAQKGVKVVVIDRKREASVAQHSGDEFLYGERLAVRFPVETYEAKWRRRTIEEPDDCRAAPCSWSNYCWEGVEQRDIPWRVLKSAWRHEPAPPLCRNCDKPTLLTSFGYFVCGFYKRGPIVTRICPLCRRGFEDRSPWDGPKWMMANLDHESLLPHSEIVFGKNEKYSLPWTEEGKVYELNCRLVECLNRIDRRGKYGMYCLRDQKVVLRHVNATITLPPFDGPENHLEEWCRNVVRLMPAEE